MMTNDHTARRGAIPAFLHGAILQRDANHRGEADVEHERSLKDAEISAVSEALRDMGQRLEKAADTIAARR